MSDVSDPAARLVDADRDAAAARRRLAATAATLQSRLSPTRFVDEATRDLRTAGEASVDAAVRYRGALLGVGAALGLLLVRRPLARLFRRRPT